MSSSLTGYSGPQGQNKVPSGYKTGQIQKFTPEAMELYRSLFANVGPDSYLSKLAGGDEATYNQMEAPALKQFSGLQGQLASRFSGMGMGGRRSSGFQNASNQAASDFAGQLQANRVNLRNQAIKDLMGLSSDLLGQNPYDQYLVPKRQKQGMDWGSIASGAVQGGIQGFMAGGPAGAAAGSVGGGAYGAFK